MRGSDFDSIKLSARYVLKEGKDINGVFYLCEMAGCSGRSA